MNNILKKIAVISAVVLGSVYVLFLAAPLFLSGILNSADISKAVGDASGFKVKLEKIRVVTTPKFTAGFKVGHADFMLPTGESFLQADNFQLKLSLLPLLAGKIRIDAVSAENLKATLKVQKNGKFLIENYMPAQEQSNPSEPLPFGIKLSNHLPDITVKNYDVSFVDASDSYVISGNAFKISDFIINKKIKASADGKVVLKGRTQFNYDIKILNKIMPDVNLNDMVFSPEPAQQGQPVQINVIDIFKAVYNSRLTADAKVDLKISGSAQEPDLNGSMDITNLSAANIPAGSAKMNFSGNKIALDTKIYTAKNELTELLGNFRTGKKPHINLTCKSNAGLGSVLALAKNLAKSFGVNDLDTLSANGILDVDFNLKSDLKKIQSSGRFNVNSADLAYGLYNVAVKDINANVLLDNNKIDIKKAGLLIAGCPLKIYGTIDSGAAVDLNIIADKLRIKGLLAAAGQIQLLKENDFRSGDLSMNVSLKGRLDKISPNIKAVVNNLNVRNIPADTVLSLANANADFTAEGEKLNGLISLVQFNIINPSAKISAPSAKITIKNQDVNINAYPVNVDILKEKNLTVNSDLKIANDILRLSNTGLFAKSSPLVLVSGSASNLSKMPVLNVNISIQNQLEAIVPGFPKSRALVKAGIAVNGPADKPSVKGNIFLPLISIPEADTNVENLAIYLTDFSGRGTMAKLKSGGILAQNLSADFDLKNNVLYLKNIAGDAFSGKVKGSVSYGLADGAATVNMTGIGMDAVKAVEGAAGIKNALSGRLSWNAKVNMKGVEPEAMMKSLTGNVGFNIDDGTFANIGRLETMLGAENILGNAIMRTALSGITILPAIQNTAHFKYITGNITFSNGWADLQPVKTSGPAMAYYITGKYNLLNGSANLIILGRLSAETVALLGPVGDLSVDKLTSYIPKFGALTGAVIKIMTANPKGENIAAIPQLSGGNTKYKDFKVVFNGGVESKSSVKSFKWLSNVDTSGLEQLDLKQQLQNSKDNILKLRTDTLNDAKQQVQSTKQQFQDTANQLKDLKNMFR
ncbi:MAG: hypothetical protein LBK53_05305 [Heliobacteriaceae bacterium]|jgi:hypothetical protein|nr:hypothetical protein [Heliobacteriaceae bacterium]